MHKNPFSDTPIIHIVGKVSQIVGKSKFNNIIILIMGFTPFKLLVNRVYSIQILGNSTNVLGRSPHSSEFHDGSMVDQNRGIRSSHFQSHELMNAA